MVSGPSSNSTGGLNSSRSLKNGGDARGTRSAPRDFDDIMADSEEEVTTRGDLTNDVTFQHERVRKSSGGQGAARGSANAAITSVKGKIARGARTGSSAVPVRDPTVRTAPANAKRKAQDDMPPPSTAASAKRSAATRDNGRTRAPRKTHGEEGDEDFIFTRADAADAAPVAKSSRKASGSRASAYTSKTRQEPLPSDEVGETPINRRNQQFRAGLGFGMGLPSSSTISQRADSGASSAAAPQARGRRDSMGLKSQRRVSSLRDGTIAYPHASIPDSDLFRHCSNTLPPLVRMRHLSAWVLNRGIDDALKGHLDSKTAKAIADAKSFGSSANGIAAPKGKGKDKTPAPPPLALTNGKFAHVKELSSKERSELGKARGAVEGALQRTLVDIDSAKIDLTWEDKSKAPPGKAPHPRNVTNADLERELAATIESTKRELKAWHTEIAELEAFEAQTAALEARAGKSSSNGKSSSGSGKLERKTVEELDVDPKEGDFRWDPDQDLDEEMRKIYSDARSVLGAEAHWAPKSGGEKVDREIRRAAKEAAAIEAGRSSKDIKSELGGSDLDARWADVEYNVDRLRTRTHPYTQLSEISERYVTTISARAAQELASRSMLSSHGGAGSSGTSSAGAGIWPSDQRDPAAASTASTSTAQSRTDVENLLRGVRDRSRVAARAAAALRDREEQAKVASLSGVAQDAGDTTVGDDSTLDLLRALSSKDH
ncbi:Kinetochore-associated protein Dsn1/Mis13 [Ceraceosorus bombacis]|uniref:Kinetochore-associated protein Dsn1/Mis13 n=1 Tax=Ceraceosorus bombacis TaxID=401625 RepID=A0A0N7L9T1_9BASI|nr:Kinetochore-associated protein Dsn1/Mis13 [Ceraceosorus bombacis]